MDSFFTLLTAGHGRETIGGRPKLHLRSGANMRRKHQPWLIALLIAGSALVSITAIAIGGYFALRPKSANPTTVAVPPVEISRPAIASLPLPPTSSNASPTPAETDPPSPTRQPVPEGDGPIRGAVVVVPVIPEPSAALAPAADPPPDPSEGEPDEKGLIAESGFNDAKGINSDPIPDSPFPLGQANREGGKGERGWAGPWSASPNAEFQKDVVYEGDGAVRLRPTVGFRRVLLKPQTAIFTIEQAIRIPAEGGGIACYVKPKDGSADKTGPFWRVSGGKFFVHDGDEGGSGTWTDAKMPCKADTWYKVTITTDMAKRRWEFAVDGKKYEHKGLKFRGRPEAIQQIDYLVDVKGAAYLDAVRVTTTPPPKGAVAKAPSRLTPAKPVSTETTPTPAATDIAPGRTDPLALKGEWTIAPSLDYKTLLFHRGDALTLLAGDGVSNPKTISLGRRYKQVAERGDAYIAVSADPKTLDLIDKATLKVRKRIPLFHPDFPVFNVETLAIHPTKAISYVAIMHDTEIPRYRVLVVDETGGEITAPPRMCGTFLSVDPRGRTMYIGYKDHGEDGDRLILPADRLILKSYMGSFDVVLTFALQGEKATPRLDQVFDRSGGNGAGLRVSPDGRRMTYMSSTGYHYFSGNLVALDTQDLKRNPVSYVISGIAEPDRIAFHPTLELVAMRSKKTGAVLFDRETGAAQPDRVAAGIKLPDGEWVRDVFFAPDGRHLVLECIGKSDVGTLRSVSLKLSPQEEAIVQKGFTRPEK
jgi:hypothetical protein